MTTVLRAQTEDDLVCMESFVSFLVLMRRELVRSRTIASDTKY